MKMRLSKIEYYKKLLLVLNKPIDDNIIKSINKIYENFNLSEAEKLKDIEYQTNHDIKAIEYYINNQFEIKYTNLVHFGLTSADISSVAYSYSLKKSIENVILLNIETILVKLKNMIENWKDIPMLSYTWAIGFTTNIRKRINGFYFRLHKQFNELKVRYTTKFGGAVGNFNAVY